MRVALCLAIAAVIAAPASAQLDPAEDRAFVVAMHDAKLVPTPLAVHLWRCSNAAAKKLAERPALELVKLPIEDEAAAALASCTAEVEALAQDVPANANNVEAIKAAIVRANVETIMKLRNPPTVACAGDIPAALCWQPWKR